MNSDVSSKGPLNVRILCNHLRQLPTFETFLPYLKLSTQYLVFISLTGIFTVLPHMNRNTCVVLKGYFGAVLRLSVHLGRLKRAHCPSSQTKGGSWNPIKATNVSAANFPRLSLISTRQNFLRGDNFFFVFFLTSLTWKLIRQTGNFASAWKIPPSGNEALGIWRNLFVSPWEWF